jgi:hypothetical protein
VQQSRVQKEGHEKVGVYKKGFHRSGTDPRRRKVMNEPIEVKTYKGYKIEIWLDEYPTNPIKEWDMLSHFVCFHPQYDLSNDNRFKSKEELLDYAKENKCKLYPLYLYDHSGITISLRPFHCPWDSGQVGWVMVEPEEAKKEFPRRRLTKKFWEKISKIVQGEVKVFDDYLRGDVYGYTVESPDGRNVDSCWGYFSDSKDLVKDAQTSIEYCIQQEEESNHFVDSQFAL